MTKNTFIYLIILTLFFSCKKYEEGPLISLRSKNKRIEGTWNLTSFQDYYVAKSDTVYKKTYVDNRLVEYYFKQDCTVYTVFYNQLIINDDGTYESKEYNDNSTLYEASGFWSWAEDKQIILLLQPTTSNIIPYERISRLTNKELHFTTVNYNQKNDTYYVRKIGYSKED